jgi:uncharacterized membrane protein (DUF4010 family)
VERERKADSRGLRTFALVSLLGALVAGLSRMTAQPTLLAVGLGVIALIAVTAYWHDGHEAASSVASTMVSSVASSQPASDPASVATSGVSSESIPALPPCASSGPALGAAMRPEPLSSEAMALPQEKPTTSVVAMTVTGCLGMLCGLGREDLAVPLAIVVASLLFFKGELRGWAGRIGRDDLIPILQFGVLSFIVLPLLPDRAYGPAGALNPHNLWMMVVLVAGVSLAGYLALRFAGQRYGAPLAAVAGGLVSSTVTTLVFARHARSGGDPNVAARMVLLANLTLMVRLVGMTALIEPRLLAPVAAVMGAGIAAGVVFFVMLRRADDASGDAWPLPTVRHPMQMREALGFAAVYGLVSMGAGLAAARVGHSALYGLAALAGLTDLDAIALSSLRLFGSGDLGKTQAVAAVVIALAANMALKTILAFSAGGQAFGRRCAPALCAMAAAAGFVAWSMARAG